jgi:hypothetical protein
MSWATCYSGSNNIHFNYPPIMSDGRNFSQWQPTAQINNQIKSQSNIQSNFDYRKYLTDNADSIIKYNQLQACNECGSCYYTNDMQLTNNTPYVFKSCNDQSTPYGYESSDLKNIYLSREQLHSKKTAPSIVIEDN